MIEPEKRDYQDKAVRKIEHFNGRALLAYQMRMGKTFIALKWLKKHPETSPACVVCPEIGKLHWSDKAKRFFDIRSVVLNGIVPYKRKPIHKNRLYIVNWDILQYWVEFLKRVGVVTVILDEVHYIKEPSTQCYKATKELCSDIEEVPYLLGLGGTPSKNGRPMEMFNILNLIRPDKYTSRITFGFRYCKPTMKYGQWEYKGAKNLGELNRNMNAWLLIRKLRSEAMNEAPKDRRIVLLPIENEDSYFEAEHSFIKWLGKRSLARAKRAKKAERMIQMGYLRRLATELKMIYVVKWIDRWLDKKKGKLALFAIHKPVIKQLRERYKNKCVVVDGQVRGKKRQLAVKTFQQEDWCRVFIGQTKAAGTVIELSEARAAIGLELDWTPGDVTQWEDRIFDQDSSKALRIYYLIAKNTIEHHLCEVLQLKQDFNSEMLDGNKQKNRFEIFDELERRLLRKG
jgi:SWI/SNF-related matrix-associated actin-dependent regulator 1 of chromatin subfamily A